MRVSPPIPGSHEQPAAHGRSLTGFYIGLGVVAALVGLGAWLCVPAKIWYWEREIRENSTPGKESIEATAADEFFAPERRQLAADRLVAIGPRASPAVTRMIAYSPDSLRSVAQALGKHKARWAMPILAEACRNERRMFCTNAIVAAVDEITGESFHMICVIDEMRRGEEARSKAFLEWWEREGEAKYGESAK